MKVSQVAGASGPALARTPADLDPPVLMDGVTYCKVAVDHPFVATPPAAPEWRLYVVRANGVLLQANDVGLATGLLQRGTVIGIAGDVDHWFSSAENPEAGGKPVEKWIEADLAVDTPGVENVLIVGRIPQSALPNVSLLGMIRLNPEEHHDTCGRISQLIDWIVEEGRRGEPAANAVIQRLSEIITIELSRVARSHSVLFSERPNGTEYDPRIWRAIAEISRAPQQPWTLSDMAATAGMSRSAFAARYLELVGMTPMRSLRRLRMHRAAMALAHSASQTLTPLALAAGYGSDAAFCRAFAKEFGHPPKQHNRV